MRIDINKLDAELFLALYTSVGWEPPCKEQVEVALQNTIAPQKLDAVYAGRIIIKTVLLW